MASGLTVGWTGARASGFNAGEQPVGSIRRIPLEGLSTTSARALALLPGDLDVGQPAWVLVHLHGLGTVYEEQGSRAPGDPRGHVRDVDVDHLEQQLAGAARPMIALLPQGTPDADFHPGAAATLAAHPSPAVGLAPGLPAAFAAQPDKGFDTQAFADEVLAALAGLSCIARVPEVAAVVITAHSGGGDALSLVLAEEGLGKRPDALRAVVLFDAVNGDEELSRLLSFLEEALRGDASALASAADAPARLRYLGTSRRVLAYTTGVPFYAARHHAIDAYLQRAFDAQAAGGAFEPEVMAAWQGHYRVVFSPHHDHDTLVAASLGDALDALASA